MEYSRCVRQGSSPTCGTGREVSHFGDGNQVRKGLRLAGGVQPDYAPPTLAGVAQLDRAPDYGSGGWGFDSSRPCLPKPPRKGVFGFFGFGRESSGKVRCSTDSAFGRTLLAALKRYSENKLWTFSVRGGGWQLWVARLEDFYGALRWPGTACRVRVGGWARAAYAKIGLQRSGSRIDINLERILSNTEHERLFGRIYLRLQVWWRRMPPFCAAGEYGARSNPTGRETKE